MLGSWSRKVLGLTIVLAALAWVAPAFAQSGGVTGAAKDEKGGLLVGNPVLIERQEVKGVYKTKTDKHGKYIYIGLPIGNYKVTLQDPNGRTLFSSTQHVGMGDPTEVNFDLAKERAAQQTNPEVQKKLEEQSKEQKELGNLKSLYDQGQALNNEKKYVEAAAVFEQAIPLAKAQNMVILLQAAANSYRLAHQYDKSVEYYQKAIAAKPGQATLHDGLGNTYAEMRKTAEAVQEFQKAAELDPAGAAREYFNLGVVMYNQGKMDEALAALKKATEIDFSYADAYFWQGEALFGKATTAPDGKIVAAPGTVEAFQAYLKLEPNGKHVAEAQAVLQTIQGEIQTQYKSEKKKKKG